MKHRVVWRFPSPGLLNPATNKTNFQVQVDRTCEVGGECFAGLRFAESWELVPGTRTVEIWVGLFANPSRLCFRDL